MSKAVRVIAVARKTVNRRRTTPSRNATYRTRNRREPSDLRVIVQSRCCDGRLTKTFIDRAAIEAAMPNRISHRRAVNHDVALLLACAFAGLAGTIAGGS